MSDTNEIMSGCLIHYDNQYLQVRKDFLSICAYDRAAFEEKRKEEPDQECMAKILRLLETLTDHARTQWKIEAIKAKEKGLKIPSEPKEYPLELTYGAIGSLLSMQEPGYTAYGESTIRNCVAYLLHLAYIKRFQARKNSNPIYWLNVEGVQEALKQKAEARLSGVEINSQVQVLKSTAKRPNSTAKAVISTPDSPNSDPQGVEINSNNIYKINDKDKKEESTLPAVHTTPTPSSDDEDAHALLSLEQERISHEQTMVPHGRGTQERLELPGSRTDHSDTRNNATLPDPMHHHLSPHLQPAQYAHRTLERTPTHDAHALSLSSKPERKTDVYTDRALVCHSLANGQSVHHHTESPATAGVSPALGGNDPSPAQMVAKEQASPLASGTQRIGHASSTSPSCSLCSEQEDIQPCQQCGTRLCFEHRRDFPSETEPTHILCVECLRQHNRAMVETPSANTELVSALGPVSEKAEPLIASTTPTSQPAPPKAARKPRAARKPKTPLQDLDEETQARVVKVLDCLDSWRQETSGNPDQCYSREDPQAIAAIVKILPLKPTPKRLRQVCDAMWNTPRDQRTGFHWQKHMTVVNICKQYDTQSLELDAKEKKATQYTNISILPVTPVKDDDDDNLVFLGPRSQRTQMRKRG